MSEHDGNAGFGEHEPPPDPLAGLFARLKDHPEEAHQSEVADALAELRRTDRVRFVETWNALKQIKGVQIGLLRKQVDEADGGGSIDLGGVDETAVETLLRLAAPAELFASDDKIAFADFRDDNGHRITGPVRGQEFADWLLTRYVKETQCGPSGEAFQVAENTLAALAKTNGTVREVFARVGRDDGKVYIDRGSPDWSAIEIDAAGWRIVAEPPVRFIRSAGTAELPVPVAGGSIADMARFLNVDPMGFVLCVGWLLGAFNPNGPHAVLAVFGQHGAAKTSALRVLRRLIDPSLADVRTIPPSERDLMVSARRCWVQAFDNLSSLSEEMSDAMCRMSTGGALVMRALRTDTDEVLLRAQRPVSLNGITEVITRPDLVDRSVFVTCTPMERRKQRQERAFWKEFAAAQPALLGAMLDAVALALHNVDAEPPENLPRMADFADWVSRGETAFGWASGTFLSTYRENLELSAQIAIEADLLADALIRFMSKTPDRDDIAHGDRKGEPRRLWSGQAAELLSKLNIMDGNGDRGVRKGWPQSASALGQRLARVIPPLAQLGLQVLSQRSHGKRSVTLQWIANPGAGAGDAAGAGSAGKGVGEDSCPAPKTAASAPRPKGERTAETRQKPRREGDL